jgi:hypothetical protein
VLRGGQHGQHGATVAVGVQTPSSADDAVAVLPQDLEVVCQSSRVASIHPRSRSERLHRATAASTSLEVALRQLSGVDNSINKCLVVAVHWVGSDRSGQQLRAGRCVPVQLSVDG